MDEQLIEDTIQMYTAEGWQVHHQSAAGIQFRKPKQFSVTLFIIGVITLPIAIGLIFILAAFSGKERIVYVSIEQMRAGNARLIMTGSLPAFKPPPHGKLD